jgi:hypothetical protein
MPETAINKNSDPSAGEHDVRTWPPWHSGQSVVFPKPEAQGMECGTQGKLGGRVPSPVALHRTSDSRRGHTTTLSAVDSLGHLDRQGGGQQRWNGGANHLRNVWLRLREEVEVILEALQARSLTHCDSTVLDRVSKAA